MKRPSVIILAAGQGTRMRSKLTKVLHPVGGRPMVLYALELAQALANGSKSTLRLSPDIKPKSQRCDGGYDVSPSYRHGGLAPAMRSSRHSRCSRREMSGASAGSLSSAATPLATAGDIQRMLAHQT